MSSQAVNENIQVSVRVRPLNSKEISKGDVSAWRIDGNTISLDSSSGAQASQFTFDHIFSTDATTFDLYRIQAAPIVSSVMEGINGTVLAYGQTSSGKTFTMQGDQEHPGIISMAIKDVFDYIKNTPDREFLLRVSYLEIYNEVRTFCTTA